MQENKSTEFLQSELKHASSLEKFIQENEKNFKAKSVPEYLNDMLIKYDAEKSDVVRRSGLSGTYAYQIFDGHVSFLLENFEYLLLPFFCCHSAFLTFLHIIILIVSLFSQKCNKSLRNVENFSISRTLLRKILKYCML